jgi:hypothetical protein
MNKYGTLKPVEAILGRRRGKRENNAGDEPNWGTVHTYMEMAQGNPQYNYHKLIKTF